MNPDRNVIIRQVRRAIAEDLPDILKIEKECALETWKLDDYRREINREDSLFLVAIIENKTVGFLTARLTTVELDILNIGVSPRYQRMGIGGLLLNNLITGVYKSPVESIWLEVRQSNLNAINFYRKKGFKRIQNRKNFYTQPVEDAVVMKFELRNSILKI